MPVNLTVLISHNLILLFFLWVGEWVERGGRGSENS